MKKNKVSFPEAMRRVGNNALFHELDFELLPHSPYFSGLAPNNFCLSSDLRIIA